MTDFSLRDLFAAHATSGLVARLAATVNGRHSSEWPAELQLLAREAYALADALIEERERSAKKSDVGAGISIPRL